MKRLTEMNEAELKVVQKKINVDVENAIDKDIENLITSLESPLNFGKYKGKTLNQLIQVDPQYIVWMSENAKERLSLLPDDMRFLNITALQMRKLSAQMRKDEITIVLGKLNKQLKELQK